MNAALELINKKKEGKYFLYQITYSCKKLLLVGRKNARNWSIKDLWHYFGGNVLAAQMVDGWTDVGVENDCRGFIGNLFPAAEDAEAPIEVFGESERSKRILLPG
jgi:hypothetical protein